MPHWTPIVTTLCRTIVHGQTPHVSLMKHSKHSVGMRQPCRRRQKHNVRPNRQHEPPMLLLHGMLAMPSVPLPLPCVLQNRLHEDRCAVCSNLPKALSPPTVSPCNSQPHLVIDSALPSRQ